MLFAADAATAVGASIASGPKALSSTSVRLLPMSARHVTMRPFIRPLRSAELFAELRFRAVECRQVFLE